MNSLRRNVDDGQTRTDNQVDLDQYLWPVSLHDIELNSGLRSPGYVPPLIGEARLSHYARCYAYLALHNNDYHLTRRRLL